MNDDSVYQRLEAALRASEDRYQSLLTTAQRQTRHADLLDQVRTTLAREIDLPTIFRTVVEAIAATFGYTHVSLYLLNNDFLILQHEVGYQLKLTNIPINRGVMGRVLRTAQPVLLEDVNTDPDFLPAITGIISEVCVPLYNQGTIVGILNVESTNNIVLTERDLHVMVAISEHINIAIDRAQLYTTARESEERYRQLVELSPATIAVHSDGLIVYINPAGVALVGATSAEQLIDQPILKFVVPQYHHKVHQRIHQTQQLHQPAAMLEEQFIRLDGTIIDVEVIAIPTMYRGKPATQIVVRDITQRKEAELQRLLLERKMLETQKMESLGVLAGGIAHDFNNLLMAMLGNASLALLDIPHESPAYAAVHEIEVIAKRAAELTQQMLAYSGKGHFVVQRLNLNAVIKDLNQLLYASVNKNIDLQIRLHPHLPEIEADIAQMRQIIINLVMNASEAIGAVPGTVIVQTDVVTTMPASTIPEATPPSPATSYVTLEVTDTGCGMEPEVLSKIFDPFFTTKFTGRGLGLAVVMGIIRGHKGSISVESTPDKGTRFMVYVPNNGTTPKVADSSHLDHDRQPTQKTVLVVDDEAIIRSVTERILNRLGFNVLLCEDGASGLAKYRTHAHEISCVLLDLTMPHMNGEETFREIRRINPLARVLLMSGYTEEDATSRFQVAGLAGFLQKPFTMNDLHQKIIETLDTPLRGTENSL